MGFKSRVLPAEEVRRTMSGHECLLFQAKARGDGAASAWCSLSDFNEKPC
jgi:hypothetical protein